MKISLEKNLAYADQPSPLLASEIAETIKPRKALKTIKGIELEMVFPSILSTEGKPDIEAFIDDQGRPSMRVKNFKLGQHVFPPNIESKEVPTLFGKSSQSAKPLVSDPFLPDHLALQAMPDRLPSKLKTPAFTRATAEKGDKYGNLATTVFPPDNRLVFSNTNYPWCTCGRVDSPVGAGSGVLVGPRHLLTASHMIQWNADGSAGWVQFRPAYFAPSAPFGEAWAVRTYYKYKVTGPTIDNTEGMYDYVVCVLDRYIGNTAGWMGSKSYTDAWDGKGYWCHVGYPGDLTGCNRPIYQCGISLDGQFFQPDSHESMQHRGDVWPGQSGGPFFAWWDGWPYVVALQSSHNPSWNNASGGSDLVDLVIRARNDFP